MKVVTVTVITYNMHEEINVVFDLVLAYFDLNAVNAAQKINVGTAVSGHFTYDMHEVINLVIN